MCFVWIWEQTAIISLCSIDWLVFITETECVYCAVRSTFYSLPTQCIYVFCVDLRTNSDYFTVQHWLVGFYNWDGLCLLRGTFYVLPTQCIYVFCVDLRTNSEYFTVRHWLTGFYNRNCAVRTGSLSIIQGDLSLQSLVVFNHRFSLLTSVCWWRSHLHRKPRRSVGGLVSGWPAGSY